MKEDWDDKNWVEHWDADTARGNPTRPEQLDILVSVLIDNYKAGSWILDIGSGSGQVEEMLFKKNKNIKIVGVDSSRPMIAKSSERLAKYKKSFRVIEKDIPDLELSDLPDGSYQNVFSVQVLHELKNSHKIGLVKKVHKLLNVGGSFLIMDRVAVDLGVFHESYKTLWDRSERTTDLKSGKSYTDYVEKIKNKADNTVSGEEYLRLLRRAGFKATTLDLHLDRAIVVGVKEST